MAVGNPKEFAKPLDTLGKVTLVDLTIPEPKQETVAVDPASMEKGKQSSLAKAQQAAGGADKLAAVNDWMQVVDVQLDPTVGSVKMKQVNRWLATTHFRQEAEGPFGKLSSYTNGTSGWIKDSQREGALVGPMLKQAQGEIFELLPAIDERLR